MGFGQQKDVTSPSQQLTAEDQKEILENDPADTATIETTEVSEPAAGKKVRAKPAVITHSGDTSNEVEVTRGDFADHNIEHDTVSFKANRNDFCVPVGKGLSEEAADFLTKNYPESFEYVTSE